MTNSYDVAHGLSQDEPGPLEPVELAQQPGAAPATGNTARDQEMYAAGIRTGEENAKHNAAIRSGAAPGVSTVEDAQAVAWMEPGIDVPVTNEYRNKTPLRQAKYCVPLYKHAPVNAPAAGDALALLDHTLLRDVLGYVEDAGPADVWGSAQAWMALRDAAIAAQRKGGA
ncbi:hypothetical protein PVB08_22435 [Bacillus thuringiensis]